MNAASLDRSARLARVLKVLKRRKESTTLQIMDEARVCAVSACISEIRQQGYPISCQRRQGLYYYTLEA